MNLYRGCCHGCIYCDSRSNCYNIIDFDRVRIKKDCIPILEKQLKSKRHSGVIQIGAMSDTYNPFEKKYEVTREALKLIDKYGFGVAIATKSDLILRDIDILKNYLEDNSIDIGIICVPRINAQKVCDILVENGVTGIWNFAPVDLSVPKDVTVENVHLSESLLTLIYLLHDKNENK